MTKEKTKELQMLFKEFKDVFAWIYKDLKGIPPELAQHIIELNTSITHQHIKEGTNRTLIMLQPSNKTLTNY